MCCSTCIFPSEPDWCLDVLFLRTSFLYIGAADTLLPLEQVAIDDTHRTMPQQDTVHDDWVHLGDEEEAEVSPCTNLNTPYGWRYLNLTMVLRTLPRYYIHVYR